MNTTIEIKTVNDASYLAKKLRSCCSAKAGVTLGVGTSLEVLSSLVDFPNWDTLRGSLSRASAKESSRTHIPSVIGQEVPDQKVSLFWEVLTVDCSAPEFLRWIQVEVDQTWLNQAKKYFEAVKASEANEIVGAFEGEKSHSHQLKAERGVIRNSPKLHVTPFDVMWVSIPVIDEKSALTIGLSLTHLQELFNTAIADGTRNLFIADDEFAMKESIFEEMGLRFCRECEMAYPDGGDGWDGMCPDCADAAENGDD